jgi:hypothetical protein
MVRAKFSVHSITEYPGTINIKMGPCYNNSPENKAFCDATPSGNFEMSITKGKPAAALFVVGREYYLDFTDATAPAPAG